MPEALISCGSFEEELNELTGTMDNVRLYLLEQQLHITPQKLASKVQQTIDLVSGSVGRILLAYGLCSNGILGIAARTEPLVVPRCHDCISFYFGSSSKYLRDFHTFPGTYYLTPAWIRAGKDPLHLMQNEYIPRYGRQKGEWAMREELKHYKRLVFFFDDTADREKLTNICRANAEFFNLHYCEKEAENRSFFYRLLHGPHDRSDFITLMPGESLKQEHFFE